MVDATTFLAIYPQFQTIDLHIIQYQLNFAANNYCGGWEEPKKSDAIMLIAAHIFSMNWFQQSQIASSAAGVASGSGGSSPSGSSDDWELTTYGRQFLALQKTIFIAPISIL